VAIIGDMNELQDSDEEHRKLGQFIADLGIEEVILVGEKIRPALEFLPNAKHFASTEDLLSIGNWQLAVGSTVLLKASRSVKLERVLEKL
jgi:UDP-N-acetylmuramoyl-tripeptide--D-alanyl-D-alanine ligase